jgi:hypothetical protein
MVERQQVRVVGAPLGEIRRQIEEETRPDDNRQLLLGRPMIAADFVGEWAIARQHVDHLVFGEPMTRRHQVTERGRDERRTVGRRRRQPIEQLLDELRDVWRERRLRHRIERSPSSRFFERELQIQRPRTVAKGLEHARPLS